MPPCTHIVLSMLRVLDHIRRNTRSGMKCADIMRAVEADMTGHESCEHCALVMAEFRRDFVPLKDTVLPGDADDCYKRIACRHGIKPAGSV